MRRVLWGSTGLLSALFFVLLLLSVISAPVGAQVISGDLVGTIFDKSGAAVPNASVEAVNVGTGVKYATTATENGEYRFNNLPVGTYNVSASAANFATTTINSFKVELNKVSTQNITLDVKGAVATVEVTGAPPALDTSTAQITNEFEEKLNADLPTASIGLGVLNESLLTAGVATSGGIGAGTGPSVGGQRPRNNDFTIEGVDNNNKSVTGPLVNVPNDAVAEFSFLQNQVSPDFGHSSGGQFNQVVKSGTNEYHGEAYLYSQNRNFNAIDQATKRNGFTSNQRFDDNRMGGTVGGPIIKDKLFFFGDIEYEPVGQATVLGAPICAPTAAGYSALAALPGISQTNLGILQKYLSPAAAQDTTGICGTQGKTGLETVTGNGGASATVPEGILSFAGPNYTNNWRGVASIDYDLSSKDQIRGRYIYNSIVGIDTAANLPAFYLNSPAKFHLVTINEYHTFSATLQNEFRVGYNRFDTSTPAGNFSFPGLDVFPNILIQSLGGVNIGPNPNAPQFTIQNTYQAADSVTWTHNAHTFKMGVEGRKLIAPESFTQRSRGDYEYTTLSQYLDDISPDIIAQRSVGASTYYGDQSALYWFVNDDWRVRPNLTVNLGLRYEYTTIPFGERSQVLNQAASVPGVIGFGEPQAATNNYGPRIGIAYSPGTSGRTSIRAGFGIAYDVLYDNIGILSLPPQLSVTENALPKANEPNFLANGGLPPGKGGITTFDLSNPKCVGFTTAVACQRAFTTTQVVVNQKDPKAMDWTLGVQHTFGSDYTVEVRYLGTRGIHLDVQSIVNLQPLVTPSLFLPTYFSAPSQATLNASTVNLNTILNSGDGVVPRYDAAGFNQNALTAFQPEGSSTYNGLATQVTRRFNHGLQFIGAYTFSHTIDNSTADFFSTIITPRRPQDFQNLAADRANSALDHRHRLTFTMLYDEPFFQHSNAFLKNTLGNWEIAPIYTYQSGEWAVAQSGIDSNLNGDSAPDRTIWNPAGVPGTGTGVIPLCTSAAPSCPTTMSGALKNPGVVVGYLATNPSAQYVQAGYGALANVGRNTMQLPPIDDVDATALKRFTITERFKAEFSVQAFNVFNHPQFIAGLLNQVNSVGVTSSGVRNLFEPQSGVFNKPSLELPSNARSMQLALKLFF